MPVLEQVLRGPTTRRTTATSGPPMALRSGQLSLLILQASPCCNLDCRYCYLPDRDDARRLPLDLLDRVMARVMASGLAGPELSIVWHAGEPMAVPRDWYEAAFATVARHAAQAGRTRVTHHFQTNAVLIDPAWCDFFRRHGVRVGVSVDGQAGAVYDFFAGLGAQQVGFNVEEVAAAHRQSSLQASADLPDAEAPLRAFWARLLQRLQAEPGRLRVRELQAVLAALRHPGFGNLRGNAQNQPGRMLNVAFNGDWCFWSPELLGAHHPQRGPVVMGDLARRVLPWADRPTGPAGWTSRWWWTRC